MNRITSTPSLFHKPQSRRISPEGDRNVGATVWTEKAFRGSTGPERPTAKSRDILVQELSDESFEMLGEVAMTNRPDGPRIASTHDARFLYVVAYPFLSEGPELYEIDLHRSSRIARLLQLPEGWYQGISVHCPSCRIFVSDTASKRIWVVNRNYFTIQWQIEIGGSGPGALAMSPSGDVLYCLSASGESLWVIDPNTMRVLGRLRDLHDGPTDAQPLADGSRIYVWRSSHAGVVNVARLVGARGEGRARTVFAVDEAGACRREARTAA